MTHLNKPVVYYHATYENKMSSILNMKLTKYKITVF